MWKPFIAKSGGAFHLLVVCILISALSPLLLYSCIPLFFFFCIDMSLLIIIKLLHFWPQDLTRVYLFLLYFAIPFFFLLDFHNYMALRRTTALLSQLKPSSNNNMSSSLKPIICYTAPTPNGHKVSNFIEELKAAYGSKTGFSVDYKSINMGANEQKEDCKLFATSIE